MYIMLLLLLWNKLNEIPVNKFAHKEIFACQRSMLI